MIATSGFLTALECTKSIFGRGSAPDPAGGAYSAPQAPYLDLRSPTSKEGEGREGKGEGREGKGKVREGIGREREGDGRGREGGEGKGEERMPPQLQLLDPPLQQTQLNLKYTVRNCTCLSRKKTIFNSVVVSNCEFHKSKHTFLFSSPVSEVFGVRFHPSNFAELIETSCWYCVQVNYIHVVEVTKDNLCVIVGILKLTKDFRELYKGETPTLYYEPPSAWEVFTFQPSCTATPSLKAHQSSHS